MKTYIAFLRGINVGGHHKVQMQQLKEELLRLGFKNSITILNSGNIIFDSETKNIEQMEEKMEAHFETVFGFPIPTIIRSASEIKNLVLKAPFKNIAVSKSIRFYITFQQEENNNNLSLPHFSDDESFKILEQYSKNTLSVLDVSISKSPKAMKILETKFGKNITTRNWNTILRIEKKIVQ